ncbi:discoidin domain-containing protein [Nocardia callitridis]
MPDEDTGDPLLRHRGAVLDALLSNPAFAPADPGSAASALGPEEFTESGVPGLTLVAPEPSSEPSAPVPRKSPDGPKASERILALLNGESPSSGPAVEYSTMNPIESSPVSSASNGTEATRESAPSGVNSPPTSGSRGKFAPAEAVARDALTQLRKPKVAFAVAGVLVVLLVLLLITTGGGDDNKQQALLVVTPTPTAAAEPAPTTSAAPAASSTIEVKGAQSKCPPGGTPAMDAFGPEPGKAWSCPRAYQVDGQVMTIDLGKTYEVDSIGIVPGWDHVDSEGVDQWAKFRTVSRVSYRFNDDDTTVSTQQTLDQRMLVVTDFDPPIRASKIQLTVLQSAGDPTINVTAISSISITGR